MRGAVERRHYFVSSGARFSRGVDAAARSAATSARVRVQSPGAANANQRAVAGARRGRACRRAVRATTASKASGVVVRT